MIACLTGELFQKKSDTLIINVAGVGYEVFFPETGHAQLPGIGDEVFLYIQTIVREDAFNLYGFLEEAQKQMFLHLIGVSGVGPKLGVGILSGMEPAELARAISSDDVARLTKISGVGKKTAERLCLELKDKVDFVPAVLAETSPAAAPLLDDQRLLDALSALTNLGYQAGKAKEVLDKVRQQAPEDDFNAMPVEELLRQALRALA